MLRCSTRVLRVLTVLTFLFHFSFLDADSTPSLMTPTGLLRAYDGNSVIQRGGAGPEMPVSDKNTEENENGGEGRGVGGGVKEDDNDDDDDASELTVFDANSPPPRPTMIREETATTEGADDVVVDKGGSETRTETRRERRARKRMEREERRRGRREEKRKRQMDQQISTGETAVASPVQKEESPTNSTEVYIKPNTRIRTMRKTFAKYTGVHGFFSMKYSDTPPAKNPDDEAAAELLRKRLELIQVARERSLRLDITDIEAREQLQRAKKESAERTAPELDPPPSSTPISPPSTSSPLPPSVQAKLAKEQLENITLTMQYHSRQLRKLAIEKDELQNSPNPLRNASFVTDELIDEYIESLCHDNRLTLLNHTEIWSDDEDEVDDEDGIGDDIFKPAKPKENIHVTNSGGSWILRQTLGRDRSIGEKLGETIETVVYRVVAKSVMKGICSAVGALHGISLMNTGDIRVYAVPSPNVKLPGGSSPNDAAMYAQQLMRAAIEKSSSGKRRAAQASNPHFIQKQAITEELLSHCQVSAPLLKLFPIKFQRALLGNIITIVTSVVSDAVGNTRVRILGHQLTLNFSPVSEQDALQYLRKQMQQQQSPQSKKKREDLEEAVKTIAEKLAHELKFLDKVHHRLLGSGLLRVQVATLLARIILTLVDDLVGGFKIDFWVNGGGPRILAGLEIRSDDNLI
mmetsp:Transcript_19942/g.41671  ORF Transcript_19942/g.41671 Transcript_19942/m.41671 type:complete len:692 (-) Transcript_19942:25-2100(-)